MTGRKPVPTALRLLHGNPRQHAINQNEPKPGPGLLECPDWLSDRAKRMFNELVELLGEMKVLTQADQLALELLCEAYAEYRDAREVVMAEGPTYECVTTNGGTMIRARPEVGIAADAWRRVKSMVSEFGLTPSSRVKLHVPGDNGPGDELDEFIRRKKPLE